MIKEKLKQDAALVDVFDEVLHYAEKLIVIIENTLRYIDTKTNI